MLYLISPSGVPTKWEGQPINEVRYPAVIEDLWADADLNAIGLYRPLPAGAVPPNHDHVRTDLQFVDGVLRYVHVTTPRVFTKYDVNKERDRRFVLGAVFPTSLGKEVWLQGDTVSRTNLQGLAWAADQRVKAGDLTTTEIYRDGGNVDHALAPPEVIELMALGSRWISETYHAAVALKDAPDGIPADFADDIHWPANGLPSQP